MDARTLDAIADRARGIASERADAYDMEHGQREASFAARLRTFRAWVDGGAVHAKVNGGHYTAYECLDAAACDVTGTNGGIMDFKDGTATLTYP